MVYTRQELLDQWMLRRYLTPCRTDCTVSRAVGGVDRERLALLEMDDWYLNLLDTAPCRMLDPEEIAPRCVTVHYPDRRLTEIALPDGCRRVVAVYIGGNPAAVIPVNNDSMTARLQQSVFSCGGSCRPVVVRSADRLLLYACDETLSEPQIDSIMAVMNPSDGVYRLDPSALSTIPIETL